jgi:ABC-type metal ion transport system substrate-binding protein
MNKSTASAIENGNVKIVINREEKIVNHLTKDVNKNLNLMFYDFNDYGQANKTRLASQS